MNMQQVALIVSGVVIGVAGQSPSVDAEPSGKVFAGQSTPFATSCVCDCEERLTKLEINVAALQTHSPARVATSEPETGEIETATADTTPAGSGLVDKVISSRVVSSEIVAIDGVPVASEADELVSEANAYRAGGGVTWFPKDGQPYHEHLSDPNGHHKLAPDVVAQLTGKQAQDVASMQHGTGQTTQSSCPGGVCPVNRSATFTSNSGNGWKFGDNIKRITGKIRAGRGRRSSR